jgi:citrate lyase subunit beta/citryl-CoA lyase
MTGRPRPRRSAFFMPGVNARAMDKARTLPADVFILDLEDAVAPDAKATAREQAAAAVRAGGYGSHEVVIRINGLATPWGREDVAAVARAALDAVLVPKVESARDVLDVEAALGTARAPGAMAIWCMIETPRGILEAKTIAAATPSVAALVMGTSDLTKDLRARHTPDRQPLLDGRLVENLHVEDAHRVIGLAAGHRCSARLTSRRRRRSARWGAIPDSRSPTPSGVPRIPRGSGR